MTPALPVSGNPAQSVLSWTPDASQLGLHLLGFSARDLAGAETRVGLTLDVVNTGFSYAALDLGTRARLSVVSFLNPSFGSVTGPGGLLLTTRDGGRTWFPSNTATSADLTAIQLIGNVSFIGGANGLICISRNGGQSWIPFVTGTTATFYGLSFINPGYGFAVGSSGTICRYNGTSWIPTPAGTDVTFYGVCAIGGTAYAVGVGGTICRYVGGTWVRQVTDVSLAFATARSSTRGLDMRSATAA